MTSNQPSVVTDTAQPHSSVMPDSKTTTPYDFSKLEQCLLPNGKK